MGLVSVIIADASLPLHPRDVELILSTLNFLVGTAYILPGELNLQRDKTGEQDSSSFFVCWPFTPVVCPGSVDTTVYRELRSLTDLAVSQAAAALYCLYATQLLNC